MNTPKSANEPADKAPEAPKSLTISPAIYDKVELSRKPDPKQRVTRITGEHNK